MKNKLNLIFLLSLLIMQGCFVYGKKDDLSLSSTVKQKSELNSKLTSVNVSNNLVTIQGSGFSNITTVKITGTSLNANLNIDSKSDSQIIASAASALSLLVGETFNLIIGTADAQATYSVTFTLQNGAIQLSHLSSLGATTAGQILKFDGTSWGLGTLTNSQTYKGTWNATTHLPEITDLGAFDVGDYYIVNVGGDYTSGVLAVSPTTFNVGDWVMFNGASWEQISSNSISGSGTTNYIPYFSASRVLANSPLSVSGSNVGIGTSSPGSSLDVKGTLRLSGATSGYVGFAPAAAAGSTTYTLPAADGTNGQVLTTNASGVLSWTSVSVTGGTVTSVTSANTDISVASGTTAPVLTLNSGTAADQIVKLTSAAKLPAVDGSLLTNLTATNLVGAVAVANGGTGATTLGASQSALGITIAGPLIGNVPSLGSAVIADRLCASDTSGTTISCTNNLPAATVRTSVLGTSGTGDLLFGTSPTIANPVITNIAPTADFTLTQNSVVPFRSVNSGAVADTLNLNAGKVGIGTSSPTNLLEVAGASGTIALNNPSGNAYFTASSASGTPRGLLMKTAGVNRWNVYSNASAESGSNSGSDFNISRYDDAGAYLSSPVTVTRSNGFVGIATGSPLSVLHVNNNGAPSTSGNMTSGIIVSYNANGAAANLGTYDTGSQSTSYAWLQGAYVNSAATKTKLALNPNGGSVGVGTSTPGQALESSAVSSSIQLRLRRTSTDTAFADLGVDTTRGFGIWPDGYGTTSTLPKFLISPAGNVGIGTITPGSTLDVKGTLRLSGSTSGYVGLAPQAAAGSATYTLPAALPGTSGYVLSSDTSGNLSWAASAPSEGSSSVNTVGTITSGTWNGSTITVPYGGTGASTLTANGILYGNGTSTIGATAAATTPSVLLSTITTNVPAWTTSTTGNFLQGSASGVVFGPITNITPGTNLTFSQNSTTPFTSYESGAVANTLTLNAGKVGIGTNSPASKLHIQDGSTSIKGTGATLTVKKGTGTPNTLSAESVASFDNESGSGVAINLFGSTSQKASIYFGNSGIPQQGSIQYFVQGVAPTTQYMGFNVNSAERLRIDGSGNVGIGTTSPAGPLDIASTITSASAYVPALKIGSTFNGSGNGPEGLYIASTFSPSASISTTYGLIADPIASPATGVDINSHYAGFFRTRTGSGGGTLTNSMAVNINSPNFGTTLPTNQYGLYISNQGSAGITNNYGLYVSPPASATNNYAAYFGGNVGIGTTSPGAPLDVTGTNGGYGQMYVGSTGQSGGISFKRGSDNTTTGFIGYPTAGTNNEMRLISNGGGGIFTFYTSGSEKMRIDNLGNVGLGNTTPSKLLHVGSASVGTGLAVANFQNADGTCTITPAASGSGIACSSDERLKENFQDVEGLFALDRIMKLQAVTYNFKTARAETRRTGYKAQEVQKIAPEFVRQNDDGYFQVYYDGFIPWITEAIKTLYKRIIGIEDHQVEHTRQIASKADKSEMAALKLENEKLKKQNDAIMAYLCSKDNKASICKQGR